MRGVVIFIVGLLVGFSLQDGFAQGRWAVSLNHVAIAVDDFDEATAFYADIMGFPEAFALRDPDGNPRLSYFQINRNTFVEIMPVTPDRPPGFVHFGLEVHDVEATASLLRDRGVDIRGPIQSRDTRTHIAIATTPRDTRIELLEFVPDSLHRQVIDAWR